MNFAKLDKAYSLIMILITITLKNNVHEYQTVLWARDTRKNLTSQGKMLSHWRDEKSGSSLMNWLWLWFYSKAEKEENRDFQYLCCRNLLKYYSRRKYKTLCRAWVVQSATDQLAFASFILVWMKKVVRKTIWIFVARTNAIKPFKALHRTIGMAD